MSKTPNAWIVATSNKGRKPIKLNNKIYLNNNEEFSIELFNPDKVNYMAKIKLNGILLSESGIVIKPGQRIFLDCDYGMDSKPKFIFKTYSVEDNSETSEAISNNGLVEVIFYKELVLTNMFNSLINSNLPIKRDIFYNNVKGGLKRSMKSIESNITNNSLLNDYYKNIESSLSDLENSFNELKSVETGRVEKGDKSDMNFKSINMDFNNFPSNTIIYTLLPESRRPIEESDLPKSKFNFCPHCGTKLLNIGKFCHNCGEPLN